MPGAQGIQQKLKQPWGGKQEGSHFIQYSLIQSTSISYIPKSKEHEFWSQTSWVQILAVLFTIFVSVGKLIILCALVFSFGKWDDLLIGNGGSYEDEERLRALCVHYKEFLVHLFNAYSLVWCQDLASGDRKGPCFTPLTFQRKGQIIKKPINLSSGDKCYEGNERASWELSDSG